MASKTLMSTNEKGDFIYSHEQMINGLMKLIIMEGLPLDFGPNGPFVKFTKECLNPSLRNVKRQIVLNEAKKEFINLKRELHSDFASLDHKISLACDVWRNQNHFNFIRVTAHWIDSDWSMQRRIINFRMPEFPIYAAGISEFIKKCMGAWGIYDKIFSITFDDVTDHADITENLKNAINPILDGRVFHAKCECRILNLCIQDGLELMSALITKIRNGISLIEYPYVFPNYKLFEKFCEKYGLAPKRIMFDEELNWDSTRDMLRNCLHYKDALSEFIASNWPDVKSDKISEQDWEMVSVFCRLLDVFYEAIDCISGNYSPSSCGILLHLVNIAKVFSEYKGNVSFEEKFSVMEEKFRKNYDRIPELYSAAAVMDPRIKLSGIECLLESFYQCTDNVKINVDEEQQKVSNLLHEMYNLYASQSSNRHCSSFDSSASFGTSGFPWSLISQKKQKAGDSTLNELSFYLQSPQVYIETKEFDILAWWKKHEIIYPVLATMARDLLIPVSTLASDCAFVLNKEKWILDETAYQLRGETMEMYVCLWDWFHAEARTQGQIKIHDEEISCSESEDQAIEFYKELEGSMILR